jgi:WD40 repeat protein
VATGDTFECWGSLRSPPTYKSVNIAPSSLSGYRPNRQGHTLSRREGITRLAVAAAGLALWPSAWASAGKLRFVRAIGKPWGDHEGDWMAYVGFSQNGRAVIADGLDDGGAIWSFPEGRRMRRLARRPWGSSPDLRYYAWRNGYGLTDGDRVLFSYPKDEYGTFAFSPDSRIVARTKAGAGHAIEVAELATGTLLGKFGRYSPGALSISPDGRTLAAGHWDVINLWDIHAGRRLRTLRGMGRYVTALSFSPDGRWLGAGSDLGKVQLWHTATGARVWSVEIPGGFVSDPAFSPHAPLVAVGIYGTGTLWLLHARNGTIVDKAKISDIGCGGAAFSPDGRYVIAPSTGGLVKWPWDRGGTVRVFEVR